MKKKVLVVDDSSIMRSLISHIIESDPDLEVVGTAPDPYVAREKLIELKPDVMTLDLEMPRMDGITFLDKVMQHFPVRTVVISSLSQKGSELAMRALELGAIDVIGKPALDVVNNMKSLSGEISSRVKAAANARLFPPRARNDAAAGTTTASSANNKLASASLLNKTTHQILAIAASTGGTEAIREVLTRLPGDIPGTVIVQHMPPLFTKTFANNLAAQCKFEVKEAADGDRVRPGLVLIAPGNFHMELTRSGAQYFVKLNQNPPLHGVRPAADPLFHSVAECAGKNVIGVILTGMGRDGAEGMKVMHDKGAYCIAQDEASSVVFGMPREAIALGAADLVLPLHKVADAILAESRRREQNLFAGRDKS